ncbi:maternal effect embryo arrest 59 [Quillaja saponaria]|uniref:Maternal effect embryo arrest 59 n=1 Tax=Quillaja saponaria TaxID=32244 RepID=A0AAD7KRQ2_QUISA|nr:maternal effect embryo arrest 59 [Quillaja saponaria]
MVGQWTVTKPSRSDEVLDEDEQLRIANQIRDQFDSLAPKRAVKPNRSEPYTSTPPNPVDSTAVAQNIPELDKLQSLQSESHALLSAEGYKDVQDEFVETQYYKELGSVDKQHHTTGTGFIKMMTEKGEDGYGIQLQRSHGGIGGAGYPAFKSNPATNDWVPNINEQVFISSKPNRSESS